MEEFSHMESSSPKATEVPSTKGGAIGTGTLRDSIITRLRTMDRVPDELKRLLMSIYGLQDAAVEKILDKVVRPFLNHLRDDLYVVIDTPYVDKMYRDSYYIFYASKLAQHFRNTIRLSFFSESITESDFRSREQHGRLEKAYRGFVVIRPTFPYVIGRTALSPLAIREHNFLCAYTELDATVHSNKYRVKAFPHSSQDGHTITCAETTIWGMLEYFSYQYAEYRPVLPSEISRIIKKISFKRTFPSEGLTAEQVTYAIRELGFGSMIYARKKYKELFNALVSIYIESGIPVVGVLKDRAGTIGHAVNIIGRQKDDPVTVTGSAHHLETVHGGRLIDFNRIDRKYVFMDDNYAPYQLASLDNPCQDYVKEEGKREKWEQVDLTHVIVPLYSKIYLEAARARKNFLQALNSTGMGDQFDLKITDTRILRIFLASSRSFKEYISLDSGLPEITQEMILSTPMPKFIWLAEISTPASFAQGKCEGILVQDATEPVEYSDQTQTLMHSLILGFYESVIFRQDFGKFTEIKDTFEGSFRRYHNNLKEITA